MKKKFKLVLMMIFLLCAAISCGTKQKKDDDYRHQDPQDPLVDPTYEKWAQE